MRAIQIFRFGDPDDVLELIDLVEPKPPGPNEALIEIEFAPLNHNEKLPLLQELIAARMKAGAA